MRATPSHAFGMGAPQECAARLRIYAMRGLRCSAVPGIWPTWITESLAEPPSAPCV